ncbi:hypothetical protein CU098_011748 [Rhizopus stolonifer]|uniref:Exopolygalacturonase rpg16 n=1 Tax=Rhizopus stolonifer TaxID=4846 RepID=A0A367KQY7_RHIST|nr:hypothetical protein CU098_011748 [Rhizopus stolonifer]
MVSFVSLTFALALLVTTQASTTCTVTKDQSGDDSLSIASAFTTCANGGTVVFEKGVNYTMNSLVSLQNVNNVKIKFLANVYLPSYTPNKYNKDGAYFLIGGSNITWDGHRTGTFIGGGQTWWDALDKTAPTLFRIEATHSTFRRFNILNSPRAHMRVKNSDGVTLDGLYFYTASSNEKLPKNTDALDISSSKNIVFKNSNITIGDDCVAINDDTYNITVSDITCAGGHGFSIGSLGKNKSTNHVGGISFRDSTCNGCENGVRIKTWAGGFGSVTDIKFENVALNNVDNPVLITTHYCDDNAMQYCNGNDSYSLNISDVFIKNIRGSVSNLGQPIVNVNCSVLSSCTGFTLSKIDITASNNTKPNVCEYLEGSDKISYCK